MIFSDLQFHCDFQINDKVRRKGEADKVYQVWDIIVLHSARTKVSNLLINILEISDGKIETAKEHELELI